MRTVEADLESWRALLDGLPAETPIFMLNLLKFRDVADYGDNPQGFGPCSGHDAYFARYAPVATKRVQELGGEVVWAGEALASFIAPPEEEWDTMLLVRYPDKAAFLALAETPEYQDVLVHRTAALLDSRLIAHKQANPAL
ncbi:MAG: DUF1330 domain-containing protein [Novosphingobium sp.]